MQQITKQLEKKDFRILNFTYFSDVPIRIGCQKLCWFVI